MVAVQHRPADARDSRDLAHRHATREHLLNRGQPLVSHRRTTAQPLPARFRRREASGDQLVLELTLKLGDGREDVED